MHFKKANYQNLISNAQESNNGQTIMSNAYQNLLVVFYNILYSILKILIIFVHYI